MLERQTGNRENHKIFLLTLSLIFKISPYFAKGNKTKYLSGEEKDQIEALTALTSEFTHSLHV